MVIWWWLKFNGVHVYTSHKRLKFIKRSNTNLFYCLFSIQLSSSNRNNSSSAMNPHANNVRTTDDGKYFQLEMRKIECDEDERKER